MTESWVIMGERKVRYLEAGSGAPVIFAAGLGISADFYKPNVQSLAKSGFRAIVPDLPGFGETEGQLFGSDIDELTDYLTDFARAIGIGTADWIGHSLGCQVLLRLTRGEPQLARSLILSGPTGGYGHRLLRQARAIGYHAVAEPWRLLKAVLRDYVRLSPFTYIGTWIKAGKDDPLASAAMVHCPVMILIGTNDRVPGAAFTTLLAQRLKKAKIVKLAGGQHGLPLDAQGQFDRAVIDFLTNL
jgi:2-hydroxy-6-oxonona-2,4-dienedioate hydrolase